MLQAYTVELEAELNYLKQENARLKEAEVLKQETLSTQLSLSFLNSLVPSFSVTLN